MRRRDRSLLSNLVGLSICGMLAGFVVAAVVFPPVAASGLVAKAGADAFDDLPKDLDVLPAPQISYVYANDGKTLLAMMFDENRRDVALSEMAPVMQQAIVASEDQRYYDHHGVDVKGVARAFVANQRGKTVSQGASTLTMQYVRQALSYSARTPKDVVAATEQSPERKIREVRLALELEKKLSKAEILERYLNIASFGLGAHGIFAASQVYLGKAPKDLTLPEAALLAGLVQAPSAYNPADPERRPAALVRQRYVLDQMVNMRYITQQQADVAEQTALKITGQRSPEGCAQVQKPEIGAGFFCDFLVRWWLDQPAFGADRYERQNRLKAGGFDIVSSLDLSVQAPARVNVEKAVPTGSPYAVMVAAVQPGTGAVLALATNRHFSNDQTGNGANTNPGKAGQKGNYPNTTVPLMTGDDEFTGYQAGSTFKIFPMTAALERGFPLNYTINATSPYRSSYIVEPGGPAACGDRYCPVNANPSWMNGSRNMWTGFGRSVNTFFVPLQERVGAEHAVEMAKRLGVKFRAHGTPEAPSDFELSSDPGRAHGWGAFTLGVAAVSPLELANAYATIGNDGIYCEPIPVIEIRDRAGNKLDAAKPRCKSVLNPDVARAAVDAARCPLGDQSAYGQCSGATGADVRGIVGRPVYGKTGTTDGNKTATLVASTKQIAIAGILADPDFPLTPRLEGHFGGDPHPTVNRAVQFTLRDAMVGKPGINFTPPSQGIAFGRTPPPRR